MFSVCCLFPPSTWPSGGNVRPLPIEKGRHQPGGFGPRDEDSRDDGSRHLSLHDALRSDCEWALLLLIPGGDVANSSEAFHLGSLSGATPRSSDRRPFAFVTGFPSRHRSLPTE